MSFRTISMLGTVITGKTPSTKREDFWDGNIPFVTPKDLQGTKHIFSTERYITENGLNTVKGAMLPANTVCVSCIGNLGYVAITAQTCISNQQINSIIVNDENDPDYVYYLIKSLWPFFKHYEGQSTTLSILNKTQFSKIEVDVPALETQQKISKILSALDDKIELNQKINGNLERQAQAIFKSWFVDFSPFEGLQPASWEFVTLDSLTALISRGIAPKYIDISEQIVLNQKCIRNHFVDLSLARKHQPKTVNEKWLHFGDLLINSTGEGTLGRVAQVWFTPQNMTVDSHITIVRPKNETLSYYIGLWGISNEREIESLHTGSTGQTELPRERVKSMLLLLPDNETLEKFNLLIAPMTSIIVQNQIENQKLAVIRDTLLSKLMSGEINV